MALTKCTAPTDVIGSLGDTVQDRGLTTQQFKDKFDETPEALKAYLNDVLTVEVDVHMADYAIQIANRIKKDGDSVNGIYINNKLVDGIHLRTGATTDGIIIKTNIPDIPYGVQFLEVTGFATNIFKIYIKIRKSELGNLSFIDPIAYSINTFKPEIKVFFLDGKICVRLDTNINYVDLKISMINSSVLTLSQVQGWSVSNGAIPVGAVGTMIVPYIA